MNVLNWPLRSARAIILSLVFFSRERGANGVIGYGAKTLKKSAKEGRTATSLPSRIALYPKSGFREDNALLRESRRDSRCLRIRNRW